MTSAYIHGYLLGYISKQAQAAGNLAGCSQNICSGYQDPPEIQPYRHTTLEERKRERGRKKDEAKAVREAGSVEGEAMNPFQGQGQIGEPDQMAQ